MSGAHGAPWVCRVRIVPMLVAAVLMMVLAGCGDTTSQPAWVHAHPDTSELAFQTTAPGVCAITVQYPDDAPAVVDYRSSVYVQVARVGRPAGVPGREIGRSGNWRLFLDSGGHILLVTPSIAYEYRPEAAC